MWLSDNPVVRVLEGVANSGLKGTESISYLRDQIENLLEEHSSPEIHLSVLLTGAAALMVFVQANWTGPAIKDPKDIVRLITLSLALVHS